MKDTLYSQLRTAIYQLTTGRPDRARTILENVLEEAKVVPKYSLLFQGKSVYQAETEKALLKFIPNRCIMNANDVCRVAKGGSSFLYGRKASILNFPMKGLDKVANQVRRNSFNAMLTILAPDYRISTRDARGIVSTMSLEKFVLLNKHKIAVPDYFTHKDTFQLYDTKSHVEELERQTLCRLQQLST